MRHSRDRRARNHDSAGTPKRQRRSAKLRLAMTMIAFAALATGGISAAQASTGGISGGGSEGQAGASDGGEIVWGAYRVAGASWYGGPSMWGRKTACGQTLHPNTLGTAHRSLPCGTTVKFVYHGHTLITQVIDRGPYVRGRAWDLTGAASKRLGLEGVGRVRYAIAQNVARPGDGG